MVLFTSDLHLGHRVISKYRNDKFSTQEEHDNYILEKFAKLSKRDIVMVLGDFIFDSEKYNFYISQFKKMSCRIKLLMGNHDSLKLYKEDRFEMQLPLFSYKNMWVSHCPIHPNEMRNRDLNIHGHMHKEKLEDPRYFNVNLDVNKYEFMDFEFIKSCL